MKITRPVIETPQVCLKLNIFLLSKFLTFFSLVQSFSFFHNVVVSLLVDIISGGKRCDISNHWQYCATYAPNFRKWHVLETRQRDTTGFFFFASAFPPFPYLKLIFFKKKKNKTDNFPRYHVPHAIQGRFAHFARKKFWRNFEGIFREVSAWCPCQSQSHGWPFTPKQENWQYQNKVSKTEKQKKGNEKDRGWWNEDMLMWCHLE